MKRVKRNEVPMNEVRQMCESGIPLKLIVRATGFSQPELSLLLKAWNIQRKRGRRKQQPSEAVHNG
jgi:hypothetical protein